MICPLSESWADGQTRARAPARGPVGADDGASAQRGEAGAGEAEAAVERALDDRGDGSALGRETAEAVRPPPNGVGAVEVASDNHAQSCARGAAGLLGELEVYAVKADGVVLADDPVFLFAEDLLEVHIAERTKAEVGSLAGRVKVAL